MDHPKPCRDRNISRRRFHGRALAAVAGGLGAAALPAVCRAAPDSPPTKFPPGKYVDIHVHLGQPWNERGPLSAEMLLRWMDANEIAQAFVQPLISPESWYYPVTPHWVLEQTKPYRDRLIPFCDVDPRSPYHTNDKVLRDILNRYIDAGAKGLGEHKWGGPMDDPRNIHLFQVCGELKLPVLFHLDNLRNTDKPGLPGLEKALQQASECNLIGHAHGWWASISGAVTQADFARYPKGKVAPGGAIDRLMEKYPNIYGDLSAGSGWNAIGRDLTFGREFLIRRADRLCFGTDYLADGQAVEQFELYERLNLPPDVQTKVFRENARRLLGLA